LILSEREGQTPPFQNYKRLLKNSATKSSFLVGDDHQVCYSDVQEEHTA
jgi:hypothetical protein